MIAHIIIFLFVANLALGAWVFLSVLTFSKEFQDTATRSLSWHVLFYNLFISFMLIDEYVDLNLNQAELFQWLPYYSHVLYLLFSLPFLGMFICMLRFYYALLKRKVNRFIQNGFVVLFIILWICYGLYAWFLESGHPNPILYFIYNWILDNELLFEIGLLVLLLFKASGVKTKEEKQVIRAFSLLFLTRYLFVFILLPVPRMIQLLLLTGVLIYANLCPVLWIKKWYRSFLLAHREIKPDHLHRFSGTYGLTSREEEILFHVLTGYSNKSIEESLNISYHTVKNHLSNIFRKCGDQNRLELVRHFDEHTTSQD